MEREFLLTIRQYEIICKGSRVQARAFFLKKKGRTFFQLTDAGTSQHLGSTPWSDRSTSPGRNWYLGRFESLIQTPYNPKIAPVIQPGLTGDGMSPTVAMQEPPRSPRHTSHWTAASSPLGALPVARAPYGGILTEPRMMEYLSPPPSPASSLPPRFSGSFFSHRSLSTQHSPADFCFDWQHSFIHPTSPTSR